MTARAIAGAVRTAALVHVRRDRYVSPTASDDVVEAVRIGARLTCLSLLASFGIFVHRCDELHVLVTPGSSRQKVVKGRRVVRHWTPWSGDDVPLHAAPLVVAVQHAVRCQPPRAAIATLDSLMHHGLMSVVELDRVFAGLPARLRPLRPLVDASAGSGPETYVRLLLRAMGVSYETQVFIAGVGRVDFVIDGWLIIECDSREFHEGWAKQKEDRRRDIAAARLGYVTVRPLASEILNDSAGVQRALREIIEVLGPRVATGRRSQLSKNSR